MNIDDDAVGSSAARPSMSTDDTELSPLSDTDTGAAPEETGSVLASADTGILPGKPASDATPLAYAEAEEEPVADKRSWRSVVRWAAIVICVATATSGAVIGLGLNHKHSMPGTSPTALPIAVLDGAYHFTFDFAKETINGAPDPRPSNDATDAWYVFRSACRPTGCVATGRMLDENNHAAMSADGRTVEANFIGSNWQTTPQQFQVRHERCLGTDGTVGASADTQSLSWSMEPEPDGALRVVETATILTPDCGDQGRVMQVLGIARRTGDVPPSVPVDNPMTVTPNKPNPTVTGPTLDGTYRMTIDFVNQTVNGQTITNPPKNKTVWLAFHSLCTAEGCVATGVTLDAVDHQKSIGAEWVLRFVDGHWRQSPTLQPPGHCPTANSTLSWSWDPQPDGTFRGVGTQTALASECGDQGAAWATPLVATRVGDVPPGVVLADPTLFTAGR